MPSPETLTIGGLAKAAGVNPETVRYYQRRGLVPEPHKPHGSIRRYGNEDVERIRFIKAAQRLGFSLDEIALLLKLEDGVLCKTAHRIATQKLTEVRQRLSALTILEASLNELVIACSQARGKMVTCPLIVKLHDSC